MEILSLIVLLMLTLVGYSIGALLGAPGKRPYPKFLDLIFVLLLWIAAFITRESLGKWSAIFVWFSVGVVAGFLITKLQARKEYPDDVYSPPPDAVVGWRRVWQRWLHFSSKIGDYQSRVILAFLYFTIVLPFGLLVRIFADPLNIRKAPAESVWHKWEMITKTIEEARRQF